MGLNHGPEQVVYLSLPQFPSPLDEHNIAIQGYFENKKKVGQSSRKLLE